MKTMTVITYTSLGHLFHSGQMAQLQIGIFKGAALSHLTQMLH